MRLGLAGTAAAVMLMAMLAGLIDEPSRSILITYMTWFMLVSVALYAAILRRPGVNHPRRIFAMVHDYTGITFCLCLGETLLPVYATLLWVTVGNGMRYGSRYLLAATGLAMTSLVVTTLLTPFWRDHPALTVTLALTTLLVPAYAHILLTKTRRAHKAAMVANQNKSRFLAQASHDLRQPVHAISLFTACLRDARLGPDERQMLDNIDKSLHSVSRLFRSLLDVSTLDSGKVVPRAEVVAVGQLLEDIVRQNAEAARWARVELRTVATSALVEADPSLLATMIQNIVSNAIKYAPAGPVLLGCRRRSGLLSIEVHDRGPGIRPDELNRVFEEFYRSSDTSDAVEGVGLGLSIVKRMAQLMDLDVGIRSRPGRGTVVHIDGLPQPTTAGAAVLPPRVRPVTLLDGLRVLLIEDDADVRLATATLLERWGCVVQAARSVPPHVEPCDVIVTDYDLEEDLTGAAGIARLEALLGRKVPAVIITGHDVDRVRADLRTDETPILSKPVRPAELRAALMAQKLGAEHSAG